MGKGTEMHVPADTVFDKGYVQCLREYGERDVPDLVGHAEQRDDRVWTCDTKGLQR